MDGLDEGLGEIGEGAADRRPSEKVKRHKDLRSCGRREDMTVSLELSFWDCCLRRAQAEACATNGKNFGKKPALQTETPRGTRGALFYLSNIQE
jgi:hypothetical protein